MRHFQITNIKKLCLLHLLKNRSQNNITSVARAFSCSKPNSKNILDSMIKEGFLYRESNKYEMTKIGLEIANDLEQKRFKIEKFLNKGLNINLDSSYEYSYKLIESDLIDINEILIEKSERLDLLEGKQNIKYTNILKIFEYGEYCGYLSIMKKQECIKNSNIESSMAMLGFENSIKLIVGEESFIVLEARAIKQLLGGYSKTGIVTELKYLEDGIEKNILYKDKKFFIPIKVFKQWNLLGNNIIQSFAYLRMNSKIGFGGNHNRDALFNVTIDLINSKKC